MDLCHLLVIDLLGTALTLGGLRYKLPRVDKVNNRLANLTLRMGLWILTALSAACAPRPRSWT